ncbi:MAG TPA: glutamate cyclase domain-containing protein [Acetobacteraceae bacterium]|nr:glutamate cyclase domain-containing protein [Acetobacteraceae bacterium]
MREAVDRIEALIHQEVGRNIDGLFAAAKGGLWHAASALATASDRSVGIITGFYVPLGTPPAAETDGPVGAAMLAGALSRVGVPCRLVTDEPCRGTCAAALRGSEIPLDVVPLGGAVDDTVALWRSLGVSHAVSIERCGRSADGAPRNMRGEDISAFTTPLDELFLAGPWQRIAIGDGGNEIGMGSLPASLIGAHVAHGETIACATPADHLIVAGVSNWGGYALIGALAVIRDDWRATLIDCLDPERDGAILQAMVYDGPAVDGVTRQRTLTVDSMAAEVHHAKLHAIRAVVEAYGAA